MGINIKEIAKLAGVSVSTVSRALNNYNDVNKKTKSKIMKIANKYNYTPNIFAKNLVTKNTNTIGLFIGNYNGNCRYDIKCYRTMCGIKDTFQKNEYDIILLSRVDDSEDSFVKICEEKHVCGAVLLDPDYDLKDIEKLQERNIPFVLIDSGISGKNIGSVSIDNVEGGFKATEHLIELGHKKIAFINGHLNESDHRDKQDGYFLALSRNGIEVDKEIVFNQDNSEEAIINTLNILMDKIRGKKITAVFTANDIIAHETIKILKEKGYRVPEDVSVLGYEDMEMGKYIEPPLTTVRHDRYTLGSCAATVMLSIIKGEHLNKVLIESELVIRESTCKSRLN